MRRIAGYLLLIISGFIAYQGFSNAQPDPHTEGLARDLVCAGIDGCSLKGEQWNARETSITARRYQWATSAGPVVVRCEREYLFAGNWACTRSQGEIGR
ncbi:MAG: hypothetical protein IPK80_18470 [Nannocystis sp.]|nr:hypothetical protein [Nannocystis sp.]